MSIKSKIYHIKDDSSWNETKLSETHKNNLRMIEKTGEYKGIKITQLDYIKKFINNKQKIYNFYKTENDNFLIEIILK